MSINPASLWGPQQLPSSTVSIYPSQFVSVIKSAVFTNTDTVAHNITVFVVRAGRTPLTSTIIIDSFSVAAGQAYVAVELNNLVLAIGDNIYAVADTPAVVNTIGSGYIQQ